MKVRTLQGRSLLGTRFTRALQGKEESSLYGILRELWKDSRL
jgi:hypothetical protein